METNNEDDDELDAAIPEEPDKELIETLTGIDLRRMLDIDCSYDRYIE